MIFVVSNNGSSNSGDGDGVNNGIVDGNGGRSSGDCGSHDGDGGGSDGGCARGSDT